MDVKVKAMHVAELAVPVKAVLNNLGNNFPEHVVIHNITDVEWIDGSVTKGVKHPSCCFLIQDHGVNILVDTGVGDGAKLISTRKKRGDIFYYHSKPEWALEKQLLDQGLTVNDIDIVINTHLHWDHVGSNYLFTKSKFYIQKDEIPFAINAPPYAAHYFPEYREFTTSVMDRTVLIDGDARISENVSVWKIGGHSPGSQAVVINSQLGKIILAADAIPKYENWDYDWPGPAGNIWNLTELIQAHHRLKTQADILIPGHDWGVWERFKDGWIVQ